eukprot:CAMPEP_0173441244 /NCGR_PEP_ID=MMETSP1357-20121228/23855_1 /TAXON_ID=77926 /ORGANISM="Hemiselmis rufescens, Strain PCC563" /LENGTH=200 /DNA_ID=CAMNT_0014406813 /DNA_START=72 /DNA_END=674 /DNA_ORIENTATION=-
MWGNVGVSAGGAVAKAVLQGYMGKATSQSVKDFLAKEASQQLTAGQAAAQRPPRVVLRPTKEARKRDFSTSSRASRGMASTPASQPKGEPPAFDPMLEGPPEVPDSPLVKAIWMGGMGGTTAIFAGGIAVGHNTLLPAWAFFHAAGASASACKQNAFETVMHGGIFTAVVSYWAGLWKLPGESDGKESEGSKEEAAKAAK